MITELRLYFSGEQNPELYKTTFAHSVLERTLTAFRGKTAGGSGCDGTFQWTAAVQALSILLIDSVAGRARSSPEAAELSGQPGSPAASLAFAVAKQSNWLLDIFGCHSDGTPLIKRALKISNANARQNGPVALRLNEHFIGADRVRIFLDDEELLEPSRLNQLAARIRDDWKPQRESSRDTNRASRRARRSIPSNVIEIPRAANARPGMCFPAHLSEEARRDVHRFLDEQLRLDPLPSFFEDAYWQEQLRLVFRREVSQMLEMTDIFNRRQLSSEVEKIYSNSLLEKLGVKKFKFDERLEGSFLQPNFLGVGPDDATFNRMLRANRPLRVMIPTSAASTLAIFYYLIFVKRYHIEVDYRFAITKELLKCAANGDEGGQPDACVAVIATAVPEDFIRRKSNGEFLPVMVMPQTSMRVIAPQSAKGSAAPLSNGTYAFLNEDSWCAPLYFASLQQRKVVRRVKFMNARPDEAAAFLKVGDPESKAIIWFPNHSFNSLFNHCEYADQPQSDLSCQGFVLMASQALRREQRRCQCLQIAIRDAWLTLRMDEGILDFVVGLILQDRRYMKLLLRLGGIHNFSLDLLPPQNVLPLQSRANRHFR